MIRAASGVCVRPLSGEDVSGDACFIHPWSRGIVVLVADGLGHGPIAAEASRVLALHVRGAIDMPLEEILASAHRALRKTRGAVATIARFDEGAGKVEVAGIGNVTTRVVRRAEAPVHVLVPAGILGSAYRPTRTQSLDFGIDDLVVMHTDGVRSHFDLAPLRALPPDELAKAVVSAYGKATDDAACAVVRGVPAEGRAAPGEGDRVAMTIRFPGDA